MSSATSPSTVSIVGHKLIDVAVDMAIAEIQANWGRILAEGILQVIFGALAFSMPILSTAYIELYVHSALVVSGVINMLGLLFAEKGFKIRSFLIGVLQVGVGLVLEYYPLESLETVTTGIAVMFMVDGLYRVVLAEQNRDLPGWFWTFTAGLSSIAVGVYVLYTLPLSSLETIGTLVGINLMSVGASRIVVAWVGRKIVKAHKKAVAKKKAVANKKK